MSVIGAQGGGSQSATGASSTARTNSAPGFIDRPSHDGIQVAKSFGTGSFSSDCPSTDKTRCDHSPDSRSNTSSDGCIPQESSSTNVKDISYLGGLALFICSTTGSGVVSLPLIAQNAGWVPTMVCFALIGFLSYLSSMFICEAMTIVPGNDRFQSNVEFSNLVLCFFGKRYQAFVQAVCFLAVQTNNIASIVLCAQLFDNLLIRIFHRTCGIEICPNPSFVCVIEQLPTSSPFTGVMIISAGVIVALALIVPLGLMNLSENIWIQMVSATLILLIILQWIVTFFSHGIDTSRVPAVGTNVSQTFGQILFNFAYVVNVPSWANAKKPGVSPHKTIGSAISLMTVVFTMVCILGGMAFQIPSNSNMIQAIFSSPDVTVLSQIAGYTFPLAALITSIPVSIIVIRYNLVQSKTCSKTWANILAGVVPWFIAVPCMTQPWLTTVVGWCALLLVSSANYVIPFVLFIASKTQQRRECQKREMDGDISHDIRANPENAASDMTTIPTRLSCHDLEKGDTDSIEEGKEALPTDKSKKHDGVDALTPPFLRGNNYTIPGLGRRCSMQKNGRRRQDSTTSMCSTLRHHHSNHSQQDGDNVYSVPDHSNPQDLTADEKEEEKDGKAPWRFHAVHQKLPSGVIAWSALSLLSIGISATIVY
ncbi:hypothetical protein BG004_006592, partial [Podila humilis]